jgi:hypothetical protein
MRQQRKAEHETDARSLLGPGWPAKEEECHGDASDNREGERMRDGAMGDGPSEEIDVGQGCAGSGDQAQPSRRRSLLGPGGDRKSNGSV